MLRRRVEFESWVVGTFVACGLLRVPVFAEELPVDLQAPPSAAEALRLRINFLRFGPDATVEDQRKREDVVAAINRLPDPGARDQLFKELEERQASDLRTAIAVLRISQGGSPEDQDHHQRIVSAVNDITDAKIREELLQELAGRATESPLAAPAQ